MKLSLLLSGLFAVVLAASAPAQSLNTRRQIEKANKETFPDAVHRVEHDIGAKVAFEADVASMGDDEQAWSNLYMIVDRVVSALTEVGNDQLGKDAIAKDVRKVVIIKRGTDGREDSAVLKDGTLTVKSSFDDNSASTLQGVIVKALEKAL